jgi:hypothetical protein
MSRLAAGLEQNSGEGDAASSADARARATRKYKEIRRVRLLSSYRAQGKCAFALPITIGKLSARRAFASVLSWMSEIALEPS